MRRHSIVLKGKPAMHKKALKRTCATNGLFGAFVLALFGAGLFHAWAVQARAGALIHVLAAIPATSICAILLYRYSRHWPARLAPLYRKSKRGPLALGAGAALGYGALLLVGIGMAAVITAGSAMLLILAALALGILPWTRFSVCRNHFFVSAALVGIGAGLWLGLSAETMPQPYYAMGGLACLCVSCLMTVLIITMHGNRRDRMPPTGYGWMSD
jgi:hypothetical protein